MRSLSGVAKRYGRGPLVLADVSLNIAEAAVVGIVGGNGAGKSTLLRIVAGLAKPSSGSVEGSPPTGYVPDRFPGAQQLSALAYLAHLGRVAGLSTTEARARSTALLERLALVGDPSTPMRELSKGNAQKVGIAQALLGRPRLLVLDEPFSGLDPAAHGVLADIIAETRLAGASVVFTDHRAEVAEESATETYTLAGGRLERARAASEPATAVVTLACTCAESWRDEPDVHSVAREGDLVRLLVSGERCDAVVLLALRRGCSIRRVERNDT
ncbi:hypothetical protein BAY61_00215 [Prauserella marina]|uniref:ABC-type multidrug transport system, ATPase component n=1 Tax=Prauserella marina TaxID=530584 RepID=A0A222VIX7_9PSEU|nr:ABC transporter ATP-binding protein [Prauserella marina]ASR33671.1 hypothetical protein BAY61_00215 [Prauserella marina]PWV82219.1 ABC-type multidrug transport system ATPase subunit [Prauserella marina]SDD21904.1 ABC-type multidrug transport system, ATPase component [Prauserella marina]